MAYETEGNRDRYSLICCGLFFFIWVLRNVIVWWKAGFSYISDYFQLLSLLGVMVISQILWKGLRELDKSFALIAGLGKTLLLISLSAISWLLAWNRSIFVVGLASETGQHSGLAIPILFVWCLFSYFLLFVPTVVWPIRNLVWELSGYLWVAILSATSVFY
jgi:hypothetical protein